MKLKNFAAYISPNTGQIFRESIRYRSWLDLSSKKGPKQIIKK